MQFSLRPYPLFLLIVLCCISGCTTRNTVIRRPAQQDTLPEGVRVQQKKVLATTKDLEQLGIRLSEFESQSEEIYKNILDTLDSQADTLRQCEELSDRYLELKERVDLVEEELRAIKQGSAGD